MNQFDIIEALELETLIHQHQAAESMTRRQEILSAIGIALAGDQKDEFKEYMTKQMEADPDRDASNLMEFSDIKERAREFRERYPHLFKVKAQVKHG